MTTSTDTRETYNGWANYPTWAVNLWLGNDEALYNQAREMARDAIEAAPAEPRYRLSNDLKSWVRDDLAPDLGASFAADLLGWALDYVDWTEIADAWIEDEEPTR